MPGSFDADPWTGPPTGSRARTGPPARWSADGAAQARSARTPRSSGSARALRRCQRSPCDPPSSEPVSGDRALGDLVRTARRGFGVRPPADRRAERPDVLRRLAVRIHRSVRRGRCRRRGRRDRRRLARTGPGSAEDAMSAYAMSWLAILAASGVCFALKLLGHLVPQHWLAEPRVARAAALVTVALLAARVGVQAVTAGRPHRRRRACPRARRRPPRSSAPWRCDRRSRCGTPEKFDEPSGGSPARFASFRGQLGAAVAGREPPRPGAEPESP